MASNTSTNYDLEKFDESNDFSLWRMKMRVVLIQQGRVLLSFRWSYEDNKGALVMMKRLKQNSLYLLQGSTFTRAAAAASSSNIDSDTTKLWHMRLGHMSERGMDVLSKQGVREKVEREVRAQDSLPKIPTYEENGSHSTEENEEPQEQQYSIARNISRREIRPPQKYGYADIVAYALSMVEGVSSWNTRANIFLQSLPMIPSPPTNSSKKSPKDEALLGYKLTHETLCLCSCHSVLHLCQLQL
ncbi:hypothetical protein RJ640_010320 [Escallonia rubra]|uniref:GAG-pre-integrase domain-containing protein n=1 Tax=Escallonia rubra TaxID=112253 RepID=A0AA88R9B0_9ASTE|nr:hypothetical protein RJ640_010320 [Escallonia rubra]